MILLGISDIVLAALIGLGNVIVGGIIAVTLALIARSATNKLSAKVEEVGAKAEKKISAKVEEVAVNAEEIAVKTAAKVEEVAVKAEEVKVTLSAINHNVSDNLLALNATAAAVKLKLNAVTARQLADITKDPLDEKVADLVEKLIHEHEEKEAKLNGVKPNAGV